MRIKFLQPFVLAFIIYLLINGGLTLTSHKSLIKNKSGMDKSIVGQACHQAIAEYQESPHAPEITLIGSSLMMSAVWSVDAKNYKNTKDVYHHHKSQYLSASLKTLGLSGIDIFSFGLPGIMVSDVYLIVDKLLKDNQKPNLIVYGIAPRDFMDDLLTGETQTAIFRELSDLSELWQSGDLYLNTLAEKIDFALNNIFYLYGKRCRYQGNIQSLANRITDKIFITKDTTNKNSKNNNELLFCSNSNKKELWNKSIKEYRARYKHFNEKQFQKQIAFLEALLKTAKERQINVMLVNMPLTKDNLALMPENFYNEYMKAINKLSKTYAVSLVDLHNDKNYSDNCFFDTVHLNDRGGHIFLNQLALYIEKNSDKQIAAKKTFVY